MEKTKNFKLMLGFTITYLLLFLILAIINKNYEFIYYTCFMTSILIIIVLYHEKIHLTEPILFGLTLLGIMHILGGNIHLFGTRLYDIWLIPPNILKYDNFVHSFGAFVATFIVYNLVQPHLDKKMNYPIA
ncbi:MAG: hypothetical protein KAI53_05225, partial [Candidatus Aenigmarchaeota archaeon]|nr:hypothetical protein [Candidatus Aenigmarchaeota archaeon]